LSLNPLSFFIPYFDVDRTALFKMKSFATAAAALIALIPSVIGLTINTPLVGITTVACCRFADKNTGKASTNVNRSSLLGPVELHLTSCRLFLVRDLIPDLQGHFFIHTYYSGRSSSC
jgi:hypothetical protein